MILEQQLGITQENFNNKYGFFTLKEKFLTNQNMNSEMFEGHENIYLPIDFQTPTQADGLSYEDELALRLHGAQLCMQASNQLKLPITTAITSQIIFQRFFAKNSFVDFDYREISMASLFLACKMDETIKKTWDIASAYSSVFNKKSLNPLDLIIKQERVLLKELGFELFRLCDHPHRYIESFFHLLKFNAQVAQSAWYYLNDSYMTDLCIRFPPHEIAAGALYLAMRQNNHPMPTQPWWVLLEASFEHIEFIAASILQLYDFEKMDFKKARRILQKSKRAALINQNDDIYGILELSKALEIKRPPEQQQLKLPEDIKKQDEDDKNKDLKKSKAKKKSKSSKKSKSPKRSKSEKKKDKEKSKKRKNKDRSRSSEKKKKKKEKEKEKSSEESNRKEKKSRRKESDDSNKKDKRSKKKDKKEKEKEKEREKDKEKEKERERERDKDKEKELKLKEKEQKEKELKVKEKSKEMEIEKQKEEKEIKDNIQQQDNNSKRLYLDKTNGQTLSQAIPSQQSQAMEIEDNHKEQQIKLEIVQKPETKMNVKQQIANLKQFIRNQQQKQSQRQQIQDSIPDNEKEVDEDDELLELRKKIIARKSGELSQVEQNQNEQQ